jgi:hypothetical protein
MRQLFIYATVIMSLVISGCSSNQVTVPPTSLDFRAKQLVIDSADGRFYQVIGINIVTVKYGFKTGDTVILDDGTFILYDRINTDKR